MILCDGPADVSSIPTGNNINYNYSNDGALYVILLCNDRSLNNTQFVVIFCVTEKVLKNKIAAVVVY